MEFQTTRRNIPEGSHFHTRRLKNLKSRCEAWSVSFVEYRTSVMLENRVLRTVLEPNREKWTGGWRKLRN
jgi:hypothetical protein